MTGTKDHAYPREGDLLEEKYRIGRTLGTGGMGAVIAAHHVLRQAPVALKFMSPEAAASPGIVERFLNEGVAVSQIDSDHVVNVLDVSRLPSGLPYLVMEFLDGRDLATLLEQEAPRGLPDVARAVHVVLQILTGLADAHRVGIIHRDLKPANCFVVHRNGDADFVKLVDFGISKLQYGSSKLTAAGSVLGSPLYIAPEQALDPTGVDRRCDLYGAAIILYELLSGNTPFEPKSGQLTELLMMVTTKAPTPLDELRPGLPPGLSDLVQRGLSKAPGERHQSAEEMAVALSSFADGRSQLVLQRLMLTASTRPAPMPSATPGSGLPSGFPQGASPVAMPSGVAFSASVPSGSIPSQPTPAGSGAEASIPVDPSSRSVAGAGGATGSGTLESVRSASSARPSSAPPPSGSPDARGAAPSSATSSQGPAGGAYASAEPGSVPYAEAAPPGAYRSTTAPGSELPPRSQPSRGGIPWKLIAPMVAIGALVAVVFAPWEPPPQPPPASGGALPPSRTLPAPSPSRPPPATSPAPQEEPAAAEAPLRGEPDKVRSESASGPRVQPLGNLPPEPAASAEVPARVGKKPGEPRSVEAPADRRRARPKARRKRRPTLNEIEIER